MRTRVLLVLDPSHVYVGIVACNSKCYWGWGWGTATATCRVSFTILLHS